MHVVIIGNGIAGITAARRIRELSDFQITVVSNETEHFFSRTALMYLYMGHMKYENIKPYEDWYWKEKNINLIRDYVENIDTENRKIHCELHGFLHYDKLLIATGSKSNKFGWPGQDLEGVQGLYGMPDLESMEQNTKGINHAVIVGGGLIGIEVSEMLRSRNIPVTFLIREDWYWSNVLPEEEGRMIEKHIAEHHIQLKRGTNLKEIQGDINGRARAVITDKGEIITCQFVALTPGVSPNIDMLKKTKIETDRGVLVNYFLETNIPDVYAAGDCVQFRKPREGELPIEQLWYTGKMQGEAVAQTICGKRTEYIRGIWFNSAKFLDIEYQTYGKMLNKPQDGEKTFFWIDPKTQKKTFRVNWNETTGKVSGFTVFGIRLRHEVCHHWIHTGAKIETVMKNLALANFDPEFHKRTEKEILSVFKDKFPEYKI